MERVPRWRAGVLGVLLVVAVAGGLFLRDGGGGTARFCEASLPIRVIDGETVAVQDKDPDGTACDLDDHGNGMATLGVDCNIRSEDGTVIRTLVSTRADGTCGVDSPTP